jgi:hypothetical protein
MSFPGTLTHHRVSTPMAGRRGDPGAPGVAGIPGTRGAPGAGPWKLALDLDLTTQANQLFATDGPYTYAGMTWTKRRSGLETSPLQSVLGSGLTVDPSTGGVPRLRLALSQIAGLPATLAMHWPLRVSAVIASQVSGAACYAFTALNSTATNSEFYSVFAYKGNTNSFQISVNGPVSSIIDTYPDTAAYAAYNTLVTALPHGLSGARVIGAAGAYASGWPSDTGLFLYTATFTDFTMGTVAARASQFGIELGALCNLTPAPVVFSHLRVEYLPR